MDKASNDVRRDRRGRAFEEGCDADAASPRRRTPAAGRCRHLHTVAVAGWYAVALALAITVAGQARAQDRPAYQTLSFNEDWSVLKNAPTGPSDFFDPIKYVRLGSSDWAWLSMGGQIRERVEAWNGYLFGGPTGADDDAIYLLSRFLTHADLHLGPHLRTFIEGRSSLSTDRNLVGGRRPMDVDEIDLENAFADLAFDAASAKVTLRGGREEMLLGKQRLVSPLDWANSKRTFEGVAALVAEGRWNARAFWSRPVVVDKYDFNENDDATQFYGIYLTHAPEGPGALAFDLYWFGLNHDRAAFNGTTGNERRHTLGGRVSGPIVPGSSDYEIEAAYQFGDVGSADVNAFMVTAQAGATLAQVPARPRFEFGLDYASGDDKPGDGDVETFNQLFPLGHAYLGYIDIVGRQNIVDVRESASCAFLAASTLKLDLHYFLRANDHDALYNAGGGVVRAGNLGGANEIGTELDLTLTKSFGRHFSVLFGYSHLFAGRFIEESGAGNDTDFGYLSLQYTI